VARPRRETTEEEVAACGKNEFIDPQGYIRIRDSKEKGGNVLKHKKVMEAHLGRPMKPGEKIRRKDGNKLNNDLSNLYVVVNGQPDPNFAERKLLTERAKLQKRIDEIDRELRLIKGEEVLEQPWT
jgi:hypothetical protein